MKPGLAVGLVALLAATPAVAQEAHRKLGVDLHVGGVYGLFGQGSDQDASCGGPATCSSRKKPSGLLYGVGVDYEVYPRVRLAVGFGSVGWKASVARRVNLIGENASVAVNATDETEFHAYLLTAGAHFDVITQPVVLRVGLGLGGLMGGELAMRRAGTTPCLRQDTRPDGPLVPTGQTDCSSATVKNAPTERPMGPADDTASLGFTFVIVPEVRLAVPLGSMFQVGLGLGALIGFADVTPTKALRQTPVNGPDDYTLDASGNKVYGQPVTPDGKTIGFVTSNEHWLGDFVIPRASLFVRAEF